eukprot:8317788-Pyramimonas_sp.AAC.1
MGLRLEESSPGGPENFRPSKRQMGWSRTRGAAKRHVGLGSDEVSSLEMLHGAGPVGHDRRIPGSRDSC